MNARKPFKPRWLDACVKKGAWLLEGVIGIFSKKKQVIPVYEGVARWRKPLEHITNLLKPGTDKTSETVRWEMIALLEWMK
ncbi:hypothetical protein NYE76_26785 [Paenibacillus sp. FSL M7-0831]|nr:hypothetical protein [Paenibacillus macerans]